MLVCKKFAHICLVMSCMGSRSSQQNGVLEVSLILFCDLGCYLDCDLGFELLLRLPLGLLLMLLVIKLFIGQSLNWAVRRDLWNGSSLCGHKRRNGARFKRKWQPVPALREKVHGKTNAKHQMDACRWGPVYVGNRT